MYNRNLKRFRTFVVYWGPDGIGKHKVQARSSLEAGLEFMSNRSGELMYDIEDVENR